MKYIKERNAMPMKTIGIVFMSHAIWATMCYLGIKNAAKIWIKEVNIIQEYYPQKYVAPSKFMKRQFNLSGKKILKVYYIQLHMANISWIWLTVNMITYICSGFNPILGSYLLYIFIFGMGIYIFVMPLITSFLKRKKKKEKI